MKPIYIFILLFFVFLKSNSQNVEFLDPLFKEKLLSHDPVIDLNNDGEIQFTEAESFNGLMNLTDIHPLITDLTGIEAFINITGLDCRVNPLAVIDLQYNTALISLDCSYTDASFINVTQCPLLEEIYLDQTEILFLDLSNNPALKRIWSRNNLLIELDLSQNPALETVHLGNNLLTALDIRNGNNTNIGASSFSTTNCPLNCILVDDSEWSTANWIYVEPSTTFVETQEECDLLGFSELQPHDISLFPNPVNNELIIVSETLMKGELFILDVFGRTLMQQPTETTKISIDVSNIPEGVYFVVITEEGNNVFQKKIIKN